MQTHNLARDIILRALAGMIERFYSRSSTLSATVYINALAKSGRRAEARQDLLRRVGFTPKEARGY